MDAAFKWLMLFVGSQVAIIALGLLPLQLWRSFRIRAASPAARHPKSPSGTPAPAKA
jgi:hypothetical protein